MMTRTEFIRRIFEFFRIADDNGNLFRTYDLALSYKNQVNWDEFYTYIIKTAANRVLPVPKYFVDLLPSYQIKTLSQVADEGCTIRVVFENDKYYDFVIHPEATTTLKSIIKKHESIDELGRKHSSVKKIIKYPKGTTLLGNKAYFNIHIPNADKLSQKELEYETQKKQIEMESMVKTIWINSEVV